MYHERCILLHELSLGGDDVANLQVKGMDDNLYKAIKELAASEERSVSQEIVFLVKDHLAKRRKAVPTSAQVLLDLSGSWIDDRDAKDIVVEIRAARKSSGKLSEGL
jgi:hypothetical protein